MSCRLREAIECLRRALIGADPQETTIHLKLAKLHYDLDEYSEAAAYHRRIVEVCRSARKFSPAPSHTRACTPCVLFACHSRLLADTRSYHREADPGVVQVCGLRRALSHPARRRGPCPGQAVPRMGRGQ